MRRQLTFVGDQTEDLCVVSPQVALDKYGNQVRSSNYFDHYLVCPVAKSHLMHIKILMSV